MRAIIIVLVLIIVMLLVANFVSLESMQELTKVLTALAKIFGLHGSDATGS